MKKTDEAMTNNEGSQDLKEKPTRKATSKYIYLYRLVWYLSGILAIAFAIFGFIELFDIDNLRFIRMGNSFQFALLFVIFGMVSRIYYKLFQEP